MNRSPWVHWKTFFVAPLVIAGVAAALWLALMAARENIRFVRATDQILNVFATARDMTIAPSVTPEQATLSLLERLSHIDYMHVRPAAGGGFPGLTNPWDGDVDVAVLPAAHLLRLQTAVPPPICRRMIIFYAREALSLGVRKIEAQEEELLTAGRLIYDARKDAAYDKLDPDAINTGCGESEAVKLILTFSLP